MLTLRRAALALLALAPQARAQTLAEFCATDPRCVQAIMDQAIGLPDSAIEKLRRAYDSKKRASSGAAEPIAKPSNHPIWVSLGPNEPAIILQVVKGFPTTVSFYDRGGKGWPVAADSNGAPAAEGGEGLAVKRPVEGGNSLEIAVVGDYPRGKVTVYLQGAEKPVSFLVVSGRNAFDDKVAVHVTGWRPGAEPAEMASAASMAIGDSAMEAMLQGITPPGARAVAVAGASPDEVRAWRLGPDLYLRGPYPLLAPEPTAQMAAEGGIRIYRLPINTATGDMALSVAMDSRNAILRARTN